MLPTPSIMRAHGPLNLLSRATALLLVMGMCAIIPAEAAHAQEPARRITQVKAVGLPGATGTTVSVSVRVKNTTDGRRDTANAQVFLVDDTHAYGLKKIRIPGVRAKGQVAATVKRKAPATAPAGRYAVKVCLVAYPDHCRTSGRTVQIAPSSLTASPTALSFADTLKGTRSTTKQVQVTNTGQSRTGKLSTSVESTSAFDVDSAACRAPLAPGAACTINVTFTPRAGGPAAGTLQISDGRNRASVAVTGTGTEPATLSITPGDLLFATTTVGESTAAQTITVTNDGNFASGTPTVGLSGDDDDQFGITNNTCDAALAAGASCTLDVAYSPTSTGQATALLKAAASPGGEATTVLTGAGQSQPALSISDDSHDYGYSDTPAEHVFTVTNTGEAATGVPTTTIDGSSAFSVTTNTCSSAVAGGASCSVGVTYTGSGTTPQSAQLEIVATGGGTVSADLTGSPIALSVAPASHDFGDIDVSSTSDDASFVVTNHRLTSTQIDTESVDGPFAVETSCLNVTIDAGGTCTFTASFSPTAAGAASGSIDYSSNGSQIHVDLTGAGSTPAAVTVTPTTADFGAWEVGGAPGTSNVTITNTGTKSTQPLSVTVGGADTDDFSVDGDGCSSVLAGGATCTATVTFAPADFGDKTATLSVSGAPGNTVNLVGLGAPAGVSLFPATFDYGPVAVGGAGYKTFRVVNTTENGEDMNSASSGPPFPLELNNDFTCVLVISTIQPHRWCTMTLSFKPQSVGSFGTTLTAGGINFNTSAQLTGTGVPSFARSRAGSSEPVGPYKLEVKNGKPVSH